MTGDPSEPASTEPDDSLAERLRPETLIAQALHAVDPATGGHHAAAAARDHLRPAPDVEATSG